MLTASRDGSICEVDILTSEFTRIVHDEKPITCVAYDETNNFMWYGNSSSTFSCFSVPDGNSLKSAASAGGQDKQVQRLFGVESEGQRQATVEGVVKKRDVYKFPGR